jgi:hypothetical protein
MQWQASNETKSMNKQALDEPLGLSIHSLPNPGDAMNEQLTVRGRGKLLAIMLLCSLPVILSYVAYLVARPQGHAGFGELIQPVAAIPAQANAVALDGTARTLEALKGRWLLMSVGDASCDKTCQDRLFRQRQLRQTQGKDTERLDWVWLITDKAPVADFMVQPLKDAVVLRVEPSVIAQWLRAEPGKTASDYLFVVDPYGNAMMRFPSQFDLAGAAKARRDLERLLKASLTWEVPAR